MDGKVFLNDRVVEAAEARISVYDHGFLYGDGIYETLRSYGGVLFGIREHLERLRRSAAMIGLELPLGPDGIRDAVAETLHANGLQDAYVRISISRGPGPIGLDPALCTTPTFVVMAVPLRPHEGETYRKGVAVIVAQTRRNAREALDPRIKSLNFLNNIQAKREAIRAEAFEAIMCNTGGFLAEGTVTNIFFLSGGVLCTPGVDVGILDGITRRLILESAQHLGVPTHEGGFRPRALETADEAFLSNSVIEVVPVTVVNGNVLGTGEVGPQTRKLSEAYGTAVRQAVEGH